MPRAPIFSLQKFSKFLLLSFSAISKQFCNISTINSNHFYPLLPSHSSKKSLNLLSNSQTNISTHPNQILSKKSNFLFNFHITTISVPALLCYRARDESIVVTVWNICVVVFVVAGRVEDTFVEKFF